MGPIVSETHIYRQQWEPLTQTVKSIVSETHGTSYTNCKSEKPITINNGTSYTNCKVYCF